MPYKRLTWKFKLFLIVSAFLISLGILYVKYIDHGYLPSYAIKGVSVSFIIVCLFLVLCDRSLGKYYMNKEDSSDKDNEK